MKVLFINARALHLGFLGCYGNDWVATPNLDRLAAEGVVFDQHYVETPSFEALPEGFLHSPKVRVIETASLLPPWNLAPDMLSAYCEDEEPPLEPWPDPLIGPIAADAFTELERLQNTYAAAVTYWDARLGEALQPLRESGEIDQSLVCVTASSGLPLGEHGQIGPYRPWIHEEAIHVPLIMRLPHAAEAGLRVPALTQPQDVMATLHEFLGLSAAESSTQRGHSLWPIIRGEVTAARQHAISVWEIGAAREIALRTPDWALIRPESGFPGESPRAVQLYVKPDDRWEVNDVRQQNLELAEELERQMEQSRRRER